MAPDAVAPEAAFGLTEVARLLFGAPALRIWLAKGMQDSEEVAPVPSVVPGPDGLGNHRATASPHQPFRTTTVLRSPEGRRLGVLIVTSPDPRSPDAVEEDRRRLDALAVIAADALDARRRLRLAEDALAEKDLLVREADHRVANALQLIHATLSLQAAATPDTVAREAIRMAAQRVAAVAGAHRHLHRAGAPSPVLEETGASPDAVGYLAALVQNLSSPVVGDTVAVDRPVVFRAAPDATAAIPAGLVPRLGLVVAELVANALKHGTGRVVVELHPASAAEGGGAVLAVSDEGPGFPMDFNPEAGGRAGGLGMRLLVALARPGRVWVDLADRRRIVVRLMDRAVAERGQVQVEATTARRTASENSGRERQSQPPRLRAPRGQPSIHQASGSAT